MMYPEFYPPLSIPYYIYTYEYLRYFGLLMTVLYQCLMLRSILHCSMARRPRENSIFENVVCLERKRFLHARMLPDALKYGQVGVIQYLAIHM